jgi:hypothetical protein
MSTIFVSLYIRDALSASNMATSIDAMQQQNPATYVVFMELSAHRRNRLRYSKFSRQAGRTDT